MFIAMTGQKRSGKDTVAAFYVEEWGYEKIAFAGPLKGMIRVLLGSAGMSDADIIYFMEGDGKETPLDVLQGKSARYAMQTLGTEWRNLIGKSLWTDIIAAKVNTTELPVITDMRFLHEGDYVDNQHGFKIRVRRAGQKKSEDLHPSEQEMEKIIVDATIFNSGSLADLRVVALITGIFATSHRTLAETAALWEIVE